MLDKVFEDANFVGKDQPAAMVALPFMEYFARHAQNEFWQADGTLAKRLNRYHDFCKQPFKLNLLEKYFEGEWELKPNSEIVELLNPSIYFWLSNEGRGGFAGNDLSDRTMYFPVTDMNDFLSHFYSYSNYRFQFKPEYAAFFNLENP